MYVYGGYAGLLEQFSRLQMQKWQKYQMNADFNIELNRHAFRLFASLSCLVPTTVTVAMLLFCLNTSVRLSHAKNCLFRHATA